MLRGLFHSLRNRIIFFFVALLVAVQGVTLVLVDVVNTRNAREKIREELDTGQRVFIRLIDYNQRQLAQAAGLLSLDFAFRQAVATKDQQTARSVLLNHGSRIGASVMTLVSLDGRVIADSRDEVSAGSNYAFPWLVDDVHRDVKTDGIVVKEGRAYQVAAVPVLAPEPIAWAIFGYVIDDAMAKDLQALSALDVSFAARGSDGKWSIIASTAPAQLQQTLRAALAREPGLETSHVMLGDDKYETLVLPMPLSGGEPTVAVLQRSLDESLGSIRRLGAILVLLAIGGLTVSVIGSVIIARGVTRPVRALSAMTVRLEEGDYSEPVAITGNDEIGELARRFDLMREGIAQREQDVLRLAYQDSLTGLPNRVLFNDRLNAAIAAAACADPLDQKKGWVAVLFMDIDRFRYINDVLGHQVGDQVVQQVALRLAGLVGDGATTARLGGDEFAVLLPRADVADALALGEKVLSAFEGPLTVGTQPLDVRTSIGVACFPKHGTDGHTLMRHADRAMYAAKQDHAGCVAYDGRMDEQREEQLSLLSELRGAIDDNELQLLFQPKVDLSSGDVVGVEALLRWNHPRKGLLAPSCFIPFAEQTGFIRSLTRWVVEVAVEQCAAWRKYGLTLQVSVNISAQDLADPGLVDFVTAVLQRHRMRPEQLCLEITESGLMHDAGKAVDVLNRLHDVGIKCSIDDFGTGYSSLSYIKQFAVDEIKIDRSLTCNVVTDKKDLAIVLSTIELGHNLGLEVVAEGVEDYAALDLLRKLDCDQVQGYLITRPLAANALVDWLNRYYAVRQEVAQQRA